MVADYSVMPDELPEKPEGFKRQLIMHIRMGAGQGKASYGVVDAEGKRMPFNYAYEEDRRHPERNYSGFIIEGHQDKALSWQELRAIWPGWIKERKKS